MGRGPTRGRGASPPPVAQARGRFVEAGGAAFAGGAGTGIAGGVQPANDGVGATGQRTGATGEGDWDIRPEGGTGRRSAWEGGHLISRPILRGGVPAEHGVGAAPPAPARERPGAWRWERR